MVGVMTQPKSTVIFSSDACAALSDKGEFKPQFDATINVAKK